MISHTYTEKAEINFSKLEERIMKVNDLNQGKAENFRKMLYEIKEKRGPTLIMATGGSKVVAYYLQLLLENLESSRMICEVIEPRDYFYKANRESFDNLIVISASGNSNGIEESLTDFKGKKYLICENEKDADYNIITWGNRFYEKERSFISLSTSLCPITLLLDVTTSLNLKIEQNEIIRINEKVKQLLKESKNKIDHLQVNFKDTSFVQIMSGYETKVSSCALESNIAEVGLSAPVVHDKGSFCHGRSNLLFQYPASHMIYLTHQKKELDDLLINSINDEYANISVFTTEDLNDNIFGKEYYLLLQMYFLSRKIADDKQIDLTQPEYNPNLIKKLYGFKGKM